MFYPTQSEIKSKMIPFLKLSIKYSYLETRHKSKNICYDVFSLHINKLNSVIQAITSLLSRLKIVMYIPTTLYEFSFILHVDSMAKTVIKGTISQLSLSNSSSQTIANPFQSANILTPAFLRKYVLYILYFGIYDMLARR